MYFGDFAKQTRWQEVKPMKVERLGESSQLAFDVGIIRQLKIGLTGGCGCTDARYVICSNGTVDPTE